MEDREIRSVKNIHGDIAMDEDMHDYSTLTRLYALEYLFDSTKVSLKQFGQLMIPLLIITGTEECNTQDIESYLIELLYVVKSGKSKIYKNTYDVTNGIFQPIIKVTPTKVTVKGFNEFGDKISEVHKWDARM